MVSSYRSTQRVVNGVVLFLLIAGAFLALAPLLYMLGTSLKGTVYIPENPPQFIPENPTLSAFQLAFTSRNFGGAVLNSLLVATLAMCMSVALSSTMAYAFSRLKFPGKRVIFVILLVMLMVPGTTFLIPQFLMARTLGLRNSLPGLALIYAAGGLAFNTFLLRGFFESLPRELEESALMDGANQLTIFLRVIVPLSAPALSTVAVFSFLGAWDEFILALNLLSEQALRTLPIAVNNFKGTHQSNWSLIFAASLVQVVPSLLIFIVFQRFFVQGITAGAVKG
jgi:ABC-type glycerol-3-phosphate transport system permease component